MPAGRTTGSRRRRWVTAMAATALVMGALVAVEAATVSPAQALDNHLARTPPMGFNDWNAFGCNVDDQLIRQTADLFVSSGLKAAGYTFVNIDDCWMTTTRSADGHLVPDPVKFPVGMKATANYVHSRGLKLGIYADAGTQTCAGYPGSLGHEQTDAGDFATWGVDYLGVNATLTADLRGAAWLRLHVDPNGATTYDHADWAGPVLTCLAP